MPLYVLAFDGDAHAAVPLSKITTNGVAWSAFFIHLKSGHIDFDVSGYFSTEL